MNPSKTLNHVTSLLLSLTLFFVCPILFGSQNNTKKTTSPPPQNNAPAKPAPAVQQHPTNSNQQHSPGGNNGGNKAGGASNGGNKGANGLNNGGGKGAGGTNNGGNKEVGGANKGGGKGVGAINVHERMNSYKSESSAQAKPLPGSRTQFVNHDGTKVTTNANHSVQQIEGHRPGLSGENIVVSRGPRGGRITATGPLGARRVSYGPGHGFVERPLRPGYVSRTYVYGRRSYARVYREYGYHGFRYYHYVPAYYYGPRFYGWAVTPWGEPVHYVWFGFATPAPWFTYYGGYFTPYPVYASPDLWLTDYLLAENLRLAYESQQAGNGGQAPAQEANAQAASTSTTLSPEVKAMIAEEVREQLAAERAASLQPASSAAQTPAPNSEQLPPSMSQKFFVVSSNLDLTTTDGKACSLTPGDIIQRKGKVVMPDGGVAAEVVSSKAGDCDAESQTTVQLSDLEEMHNQLREQLDSGLKVLAENKARAFPNEPAAGVRPLEEGTTDPTPDADKQLASQEADAAKLEAQVAQGSGSGSD